MFVFLCCCAAFNMTAEWAPVSLVATVFSNFVVFVLDNSFHPSSHFLLLAYS